MDRRNAVITTLVLSALAASTAAKAQPSARLRRIGVLAFSNPVAGRPYIARFTEELAKLGWVEGQTLQSIYRYADGDAARLAALAAELVALEPDVLFSPNTQGSIALARTTKRIPIVMTGPDDPVRQGLIESLARPGGNVTGIALGTGNDIVGKRLEILRQWLPRFSRLAVIVHSGEDRTALIGSLEPYANRLGLRTESINISNVSEIRSAIDALSMHPPDAVYLFSTAFDYTNRDAICAELMRIRVPTLALSSRYAEAGCLASYATPSQERESAQYVDQILRGANPAETPVRQPTHVELVINARTAAAIGLAIPQKLRVMADRVIE